MAGTRVLATPPPPNGDRPRRVQVHIFIFIQNVTSISEIFHSVAFPFKRHY
jgi:hypothetical protein